MQYYTWFAAGFPLSHGHVPRSAETGVSSKVTQAQAYLLLSHLLQSLHQRPGVRATELRLQLHRQHLPLLFKCLLDYLQEFSSPVKAGVGKLLKLEQEAQCLQQMHLRLEQEPLQQEKRHMSTPGLSRARKANTAIQAEKKPLKTMVETRSSKVSRQTFSNTRPASAVGPRPKVTWVKCIPEHMTA